jgi:hypothetical protein
MPRVTRYYQLDEANVQLDELGPLLLTLSQQRSQLIRLRDVVLAADAGVPAAGNDEVRPDPRAEREATPDEGLRLTRLRMQGLIDQMQAAVARIDELGVVLRDIETGLIDFPALVNGRQVWLCWRLGEDQIDYWHELTSGVAGRRHIIDLA